VLEQTLNWIFWKVDFEHCFERWLPHVHFLNYQSPTINGHDHLSSFSPNLVFYKSTMTCQSHSYWCGLVWINLHRWSHYLRQSIFCYSEYLTLKHLILLYENPNIKQTLLVDWEELWSRPNPVRLIFKHIKNLGSMKSMSMIDSFPWFDVSCYSIPARVVILFIEGFQPLILRVTNKIQLHYFLNQLDSTLSCPSIRSILNSLLSSLSFDHRWLDYDLFSLCEGFNTV
jgi:hypothetical protein